MYIYIYIYIYIFTFVKISTDSSAKYYQRYINLTVNCIVKAIFQQT